MKLVSIQSPYAGDPERNTAYARRALTDSLSRDEAPFASHLLYTQVIDESSRGAALQCDHAFLAKCDLVAFYMDLGFSPGMHLAHQKAIEFNVPIELRQIGICP